MVNTLKVLLGVECGLELFMWGFFLFCFPGTVLLPPESKCLAFSFQLDIFDAAERYKQAGHPLIVLAGKEYGTGSSRDWAAKGPFLLVSDYSKLKRRPVFKSALICQEDLAYDQHPG